MYRIGGLCMDVLSSRVFIVDDSDNDDDLPLRVGPLEAQKYCAKKNIQVSTYTFACFAHLQVHTHTLTPTCLRRKEGLL